MIAVDELLERASEAKARRDSAATELTALVKALDGMAGIDGMLDQEQRRHLASLKKKPTVRRTRKRARRRAS